ncbi:MAG: hypothetical protein JWM11_3503 [Planctomycetaceae bacterium]|nr:hypothetical protein [Planctomycetaceae bacterium]
MNLTSPNGPQPELSQTQLEVGVGCAPFGACEIHQGPIPGRWLGLSNRRPLVCKYGMVFNSRFKSLKQRNFKT